MQKICRQKGKISNNELKFPLFLSSTAPLDWQIILYFIMLTGREIGSASRTKFAQIQKFFNIYHKYLLTYLLIMFDFF